MEEFWGMWFFDSVQELSAKTPIHEDPSIAYLLLENWSITLTLELKYYSRGKSKAKTWDLAPIERYLTTTVSRSTEGIFREQICIWADSIGKSWWNREKSPVKKMRSPKGGLFRRVCSSRIGKFTSRMHVSLPIWGGALIDTGNFHISSWIQVLFVRKDLIGFRIAEIVRRLSIPRLFNSFSLFKDEISELSHIE
jgi:hypothetical protein